ncbi:MAG: leucine-rich repeat domain-containing protein [Prevotella sp.]
MRKCYFSLLALLMSLSTVQAQDFTADSIQYQINPDKEGEVSVWGFTCASGIVNVPSQVTNIADGKSYTVTAVAGVIPSENWWEDGTPNGFKNRIELKSVTLPATVRTIGNNAFEGSGIERITMPEEMDSIGDEAFVWCSNLAEADMPKTLRYLGYSAFTNCTALTYISVPKGLTWSAYKPDGAFMRCGNLRKADLPSDMTAVPKNFFNGCQNLTDVTLPDSVSVIGYQSFYGCLNLNGINIPEKLTEIGNMAFQDCASMTSFKANDSLKRINYWAFKNCYSLADISLSASVEEIDNQAFKGCNHVEELKVSDQNAVYSAKDNMLLSKDGKVMFFRLDNGTRILALPDGLETIGESAVADGSVKVIVVPSSIKEVQQNAFYNDSILAIHFQGVTPPAIANDMFNLALAGAKAYVPRGMAEAYKAVGNLGRFRIEEEDALPFIHTGVLPLNEKYVQALDTIEVEFEEPATLGTAAPEMVVLEDSVAMNYAGKWTAELANGGKKLLLVYRNGKGEADKLPLTGKKEYLISVPAAVVSNAQGVANAVIEINVYGPDSLKVTYTSPAEGEQLAYLKEVCISFDSNARWVSQYGNNDFKLYKNGVECELPKGMMAYPKMNGSNGVKYDIFNSSFMNDSIALEEGAQYRIVIPAGIIYKTANTETRNDEIVINFSGLVTTGINAASTHAQYGSDKVYTVSGVLVKDDVNSLPSGIYIVRGKKMVVRKK